MTDTSKRRFFAVTSTADLASEAVSFEAKIMLRQTEFGMTEAAKKTRDEVPVTVSIRGRRN